jgi:hypothetical protein
MLMRGKSGEKPRHGGKSSSRGDVVARIPESSRKGTPGSVGDVARYVGAQWNLDIDKNTLSHTTDARRPDDKLRGMNNALGFGGIACLPGRLGMDQLPCGREGDVVWLMNFCEWLMI